MSAHPSAQLGNAWALQHPGTRTLLLLSPWEGSPGRGGDPPLQSGSVVLAERRLGFVGLIPPSTLWFLSGSRVRVRPGVAAPLQAVEAPSRTAPLPSVETDAVRAGGASLLGTGLSPWRTRGCLSSQPQGPGQVCPTPHSPPSPPPAAGSVPSGHTQHLASRLVWGETSSGCSWVRCGPQLSSDWSFPGWGMLGSVPPPHPELHGVKGSACSIARAGCRCAGGSEDRDGKWLKSYGPGRR